MLKRNDNYRSTKNCYIGGNNIKYIVVHYTGYFAPIKNYCLSQMNNDLNGSAHDFVNDDEWYNAIPHNYIAWAVGDDNGYGHFPNGIRNDNSLSIEMCCCNANLDVSEKTMRNTAEIVAYYMKIYDIPIQNVKRHYDASYKACPRDMTPYVKDGNSRWGVFLSWVQQAYEGKPVSKPAPKKTTPKCNLVARKDDHVKILNGAWYGKGENKRKPFPMPQGTIDALNTKDLKVSQTQINDNSHEAFVYYDNGKGVLEGDWIPVNCIEVNPSLNFIKGDKVKIKDGAWAGKSPNGWQPRPMSEGEINALNGKGMIYDKAQINYNSHEACIYYVENNHIGGVIWIPINCIYRV